ncbi:hypothetical protein PJE062_783 [Pseudovibrio sp. JE062]|nr:hypothetical protein PJE062_783 [Pseudovibrio sp. JE062]
MFGQVSAFYKWIRSPITQQLELCAAGGCSKGFVNLLKLAN